MHVVYQIIPFSITLPTAFSNKLVIQDFGCGLSEENIVNILVHCWKTSKDQDNNAVGAYGIGCKSKVLLLMNLLSYPFCRK